MYIHVYDAEHAILLALFPAGRITPDDWDRLLAAIHKLADDVARHGRPAISFQIVESNDRPDAVIRKRIAEADARIPNQTFCFVTQSRIARAMMTAIHWLSPAQPGITRGFHPTYEAGRDWVVATTGIPAARMDALYAKLRRLEARGGAESARR